MQESIPLYNQFAVEVIKTGAIGDIMGCRTFKNGIALTTSTTNSKPDKGERVPTAAPAQAKIPPMPTKYNTPGWDSLDKYVQQRAQQSWFDTYGRRYNADGTTNYGAG